MTSGLPDIMCESDAPPFRTSPNFPPKKQKELEIWDAFKISLQQIQSKISKSQLFQKGLYDISSTSRLFPSVFCFGIPPTVTRTFPVPGDRKEPMEAKREPASKSPKASSMRSSPVKSRKASPEALRKNEKNMNGTGGFGFFPKGEFGNLCIWYHTYTYA